MKHIGKSGYLAAVLAVTALTILLCLGVSAAEREISVVIPDESTEISRPRAGRITAHYTEEEGLVIDSSDEYEITDPDEYVLCADEYSSDLSECCTKLRNELKKRSDPITIRYKYKGTFSEAKLDEIFKSFISGAERHTGVPNEGDYIYWQYGRPRASVGYSEDGTWVYLSFTVEIAYIDEKGKIRKYYTTKAEEEQVDAAVKNLISELGLKSMKSDYQKVKAVHDWIVGNVGYDFEHKDIDEKTSGYRYHNTAYGAIIRRTCVCQGYSAFFYRMMLECGIDSRVITGLGYSEGAWGAHAWNIVKLDGKWYNIDTTWDRVTVKNFQGDIIGYYTTHDSFLCGSSSPLFPNHQRDSEYTSSEFNASYPMASKNYVYADLNGDGRESISDAVYLLWHVMKPSDSRYALPSGANCDYNGVGGVTVDDAKYLLWHMFYPSQYPIN